VDAPQPRAETWDERRAREEKECRLQAGWVIRLGDGKEYVVDYVNASRAYCIPLGKRDVEVPTEEVDEETGEVKTKKFSARERGINIAPTAMVEILRKEEPMAKRLCTVCGKGLHSDNKGDTHRACRKQADPMAPTAAEVDATSGPVISNETANETTTETQAGETAATAEAEAPQQKEQNVAKKQAKAAPKAKAAKASGAAGRTVNSYTLAAKQPKEGEFRDGSQIALVYEAVSSIGTATAAEVVTRVSKKAQSKGDLKANVAFYLSKLKGAGFIKIAR
jgi:hypothetical protein